MSDEGARMGRSMQDDGAELLIGLLRLPSPSGQEGRAVMHLVDWLAGHGFSAHRDAAGNAVGVLEGPPAGGPLREVVLLGHIDTVAGFPPVALRDGKLYGRGAVDAKGPLAAFATAAALLGSRPGWRIIVAGAVEEEAATSRGARALAEQLHPDHVVIGEPTGWQRVALGYKGRLLADAAIHRPVSHTAGPAASAAELAIDFWLRVCARVEEMNAGQPGVWDQIQVHLRGFASEDDGIADTAALHMGFRLPPAIPPEVMAARLLEVDPAASLRFSGGEPAFRAGKNTPLVRAFLAAIRARGGVPAFVMKTGTSDMNVVGPRWGCPILAFGPGDSTLDHTPEEHVEIAEWLSGVQVLVEALDRLTNAT